MYGNAATAADYDVKATVVFTDGFEDRAPLIADVQPLINERVYAVGVADAVNVRNEILRQVANDTGGTMLVTGAIAQDDEFLLEKFFIQILAGVTNRDIVRDPPGVIVPGQVSRMPFFITRSDIAFDAVALTRAPQYVAIALEAPDGTFISPGQLPAGAFRPGSTSRNFRVVLPVVVNGVGHWEGEWKLLLAMRGFGHDRVHSWFQPAAAMAAALTIPFHGIVHARSNLRMRAGVSQSALTPGAVMHLRAVLTEYGQPLLSHPSVSATLTRPDLTTGGLVLNEVVPGEFETSLVASQVGVYRFLVQAAGLSSRGHAFTREQLLTAVVGRPQGPPGTSSEPERDKFCNLIKCLFANGVINERLDLQLRTWGIDPGRLRECLTKVCTTLPERRS